MLSIPLPLCAKTPCRKRKGGRRLLGTMRYLYWLIRLSRKRLMPFWRHRFYLGVLETHYIDFLIYLHNPLDWVARYLFPSQLYGGRCSLIGIVTSDLITGSNLMNFFGFRYTVIPTLGSLHTVKNRIHTQIRLADGYLSAPIIVSRR